MVTGCSVALIIHYTAGPGAPRITSISSGCYEIYRMDNSLDYKVTKIDKKTRDLIACWVCVKDLSQGMPYLLTG